MGRPKKAVEQTCFDISMPKSDSPSYGIMCTGSEGIVGWFMNDRLEVATYPTPEKAEKAMKERLKDKHYSWNCKVEVAPFYGLPNEYDDD